MVKAYNYAKLELANRLTLTTIPSILSLNFTLLVLELNLAVLSTFVGETGPAIQLESTAP